MFGRLGLGLGQCLVSGLGSWLGLGLGLGSCFNRSVGTITTAYLLVNKLHIS